MKKTIIVGLLISLVCLGLPAFAKSQAQSPQKGFAGFYCTPPRFQIFEAPRPYGGLLMVDTQTGESYQRVILNTAQGIQIRWLKLERMTAPKPGETILWE